MTTRFKSFLVCCFFFLPFQSIFTLGFTSHSERCDLREAGIVGAILVRLVRLSRDTRGANHLVARAEERKVKGGVRDVMQSNLSTCDAPVSFFHGPINAVATLSCGVLFSSGNQVWRSAFSTRQKAKGAPIDVASTARLCATVPDGAIITCIAVMNGATADGSGTASVILMGTADRLFAKEFIEREDGDRDFVARRPPTIRNSDSSVLSGSCILNAMGGRLLSIIADERRGVIVVLTGSNDLFIGRVKSRCCQVSQVGGSVTALSSGAVETITFRRIVGPSLGVVLAATAVVKCSCSSDTCGDIRCTVYAATYAGTVVEWVGVDKGDAVNSSPNAPGVVQSTIAAHGKGCAIFSVCAAATTAKQRGEHGLATSYIATCSDDRTATLFARRESEGAKKKVEWILIWRGSGASFSRSRVFDVDLLLKSSVHNSSRAVIYIGIASEDGGVQVAKVNPVPRSSGGEAEMEKHVQGASSCRESSEARVCIAHSHQHRGHGTYRVAFIPVGDEDEEPRIVSGGFDGTVALHQCDEQREVSFTVLHGGRSATGKQSGVRVVHIDSQGWLLACTGSRLFVYDSVSKRKWEVDLPFGGSDAETARKENLIGSQILPTVLETIAVPALTSDSRSVELYAVIGTTSGSVGLTSYTPSPDSSAAGPFFKCCTASVYRSKVTHMSVLPAGGSAKTLWWLATSHIHGAVVLSLLQPSSCKEEGGSGLSLTPLTVYEDTAGPLVSTIALLSTGPGEDDACAAPFWLLIGDRSGTLHGVAASPNISLSSTGAPSEHPQIRLPLCNAAVVCATPFLPELRLGIECVYVEHDDGSRGGHTICVVGSGGAFAYLILPAISSALSSGVQSGVAAGAHHAEPMRFVFECATVLTASRQAWVLQSGATVSMYRRFPGSGSWTLVNSSLGVRAPRLLAARVKQSTLDREVRFISFAHCSDGKTVSCSRYEQQVAPKNMNLGKERAGSLLKREVPFASPTTLLHDGGLPGKDYTSVAYAPSPLNCLVLGNEDSCLTFYPLSGDQNTNTVASSAVAGVEAPLSVIGPHHSNILALCVVAPPLEKPSGQTMSGPQLLLTVGSVSIMTLWGIGGGQPFHVVDAWYGGKSEDSSDTQPKERRFRSLHGLRSQNAEALAERIPRYLSTVACSSWHAVVSSSDGMLLKMRVRESDGVPVLRCEWKAVLNLTTPKPIMALSVLDEREGGHWTNLSAPHSSLVLAGDTNGMLYVVDTNARRVLGEQWLERSCLNALSSGHRIHGSTSPDSFQWRCAALHDSGVVRLLALFVSLDAQGTPTSVTISCLCAASTGLTAGRSVHWAPRGHPLTVVTEDRVIYYDSAALQKDELRAVRERRTSVRCVSGACVVPMEQPSHQPEHNNQMAEPALLVAVSGQGFELLS